MCGGGGGDTERGDMEGGGVDGERGREGGGNEREERGNETNRQRQLDNETDIQTAAEKD